MKKLLTILTLLLCLTSFAQKSDSLVTVKGVVWDSTENEPVPFAFIYGVIKGNSIKEKICVSDFDGKFKTKLNVNKYQDSLIVSYLGMETKFHFKNSEKVNFQYDEEILNELKMYHLQDGKIDLVDKNDYGKNVEGYVYKRNKEPIANAEINIDGFKNCHLNGYVTRTDSNGYFKTNKVYGGFENLFVISRWNGKKKKEYLSSSNYNNIKIYFDEKIENPVINPHVMSTGTFYSDGEFESIK